MSNSFKNWFSYTVFHFSSHKGLLLAIVVDIAFLVFAVIDYYKSISTAKIVINVAILITFNLLWQFVNFFKRFRLYKNVDCRGVEEDLSPESSQKYLVKEDLTGKYKYTLDEDYPILRNHVIDKALQDENSIVIVENDTNAAKNKRERIKDYYSHYESTLLYFLNKKWHNSNFYDGEFVNEKKICFTSEPSFKNNSCKFYICPGQYYYGYMTNAIYCKSINSDGFIMDAPANFKNHKIEPYQNSYFSDHIGVSTLVVSTDDDNKRNVLIFQQSSSAGKSAKQLCPTGSGSMDWSDYKRKDRGNLKNTIISAAERELREECKISKRKWEKIKKDMEIKTRIIAYYRDLRFGGKPEFCCVTEISNGGDLSKQAHPNKKELSSTFKRSFLLNSEGWNDILNEKDDQGKPRSISLALKVNFKLAMDYYKELDKKREANPLIS